MKHGLTSCVAAHLLALLGAMAVHAGVAGWVMQPDPPTILPQQQIIQVSMVTPTVIKQKPAKPAPEIKPQPQPAVPPAAKGMVKQPPKTQPKPEPGPGPEPPRRAQPERPEQKPEDPPQSQVSQQRLTSGLSQKQAAQLAAAVTKPVAASYLDNPPPRYPEKARLRKQEGTVLLDVRVRTDGTSEDVRVLSSSGYALLDRAALEAVRQWRFVPAKRGSQLIEANVEVPIKFQIQRRRKL